MSKNLNITIGLVLASLIFLCVVVGSAELVSQQECNSQWEDTGMNYRWSFDKACQVQVGKGWWPVDKIKVDPYTEGLAP